MADLIRKTSKARAKEKFVMKEIRTEELVEGAMLHSWVPRTGTDIHRLVLVTRVEKNTIVPADLWAGSCNLTEGRRNHRNWKWNWAVMRDMEQQRDFVVRWDPEIDDRRVHHPSLLPVYSREGLEEAQSQVSRRMRGFDLCDEMRTEWKSATADLPKTMTSNNSIQEMTDVMTSAVDNMVQAVLGIKPQLELTKLDYELERTSRLGEGYTRVQVSFYEDDDVWIVQAAIQLDTKSRLLTTHKFTCRLV